MKKPQLNENIRNAIKQAGYRQKEVASLLDVTPSAVSEWVTGKSAPRYGMLVRLAEVLNRFHPAVRYDVHRAFHA